MVSVSKVRIYELAKALGVANKDVMDLLEKQFDVTVKSHSSTIEPELADKVKAALSKGAAPKSETKPTKVEKQADQKTAPKPAEKAPASKAKSEPVAAQSEPTPAPKSVAKAEVPVAKSSPEPAKSQPQEASPSVASASPKSQPSTSPVKSSSTAVKEAPAAVKQETPVVKQYPVQAEGGKSPEPVSSASQKMDKIVASAPDKTEAPAADKSKTVETSEDEEPLPQVTIPRAMPIEELALLLKKRDTEVIKHLFMKGIMTTKNQTMQIDDAVALAKELGFDAKGPDVVEVDFAAPELQVKKVKGKHLKPRWPVVSIMGHVDHGKTSLLDAIRQSRHKIVDTEAGGITQSIGAYTVEQDDHKIVFIDTPGHAAFTSMRMRGAQATDIAILVVAADDGVMPQTIEAINHAKAANIPIIVAINKIDKADADPDKVMVQLSDHGLVAEKWGGDALMVEVSAHQKYGLDDLLTNISLLAELQELKADPTLPAEGVVIEAHLDKGKGPVATVLVQNGTLTVGEYILLDSIGGRVRALISDQGERVKSAGPSTPVEVLGLNEVPKAGDRFVEVRNDKEFKRLLAERQSQAKQQRHANSSILGLMSDKEQERKDFNVIVKADTQGSVEAISQAILQLATEEVSVKVIHAGTGEVSEADVLLASASQALIVAFNVREEGNAQRAAQDQGVMVRPYDVIYHVTEDIEKMMLGLLSPDLEEEELGVVEVRQIITIGKNIIAGSYVSEGKVVRNSQCRVFRGGKEIFKGVLNNLKRFKEDAKEVASGYECGISFDKFNDLQEGDIIRVFAMKEIERTSL